MSLIQFFLIVFAVFAITRTFIQFKKGKLTLAMLFLWILFWVIVGVVVLLPNTTNTLARFVGVGRGVDVIMYVAIIALFYLVFRLFVMIEDTEREITRLVRTLAVKEMDQKDDCHCEEESPTTRQSS